MPRIRHVGGPVRYNHRALTGVSEPGDEHTVSDKAAEYLLNRRHFERVADEVVLDDDEYDVVDDADGADGGELVDANDKLDRLMERGELSELTKSELYDRATEADIDGRSTMDKAELIDALRED